LIIIVTAALLSCFQFASAKGIRTISISENEVAQVRVALGYSTLLQFDTRPAQAIIGDQDSFKIEYAGTSIAIKPLVSGVSTNLFIITEYEKFNFRITAGHGFEPDYILRIKKKKDESREPSSGLITKTINAKSLKNGVLIRLISVATTKSNSSLIYSFEVTAKDRKLTFLPGDFEVLQAGRSLPIENIYLERLNLNRGQKIYGMILIRRDEIQRRLKTSLRFSHGSNKEGIQVLAPPI
jgi:hypothetical protein